MRVEFTNNNWNHSAGVWAIGYAFLPNGSFLRADDLCGYLADATSVDNLFEKLKDLNGLFSAVISKPGLQAAAVDIGRSFPVYFRKMEGDMVVTDNPHLLRMEGDRLSAQALIQYDSAGAVSEGLTLVEGISQVKPAHVCDFLGEKLEQTAYFCMGVRSDEVKGCNKPGFMAVLYRIFRRLKRSAENSGRRRQLVVPLSGGFDSRLIACMLKELDYGYVLCYTIGSHDSTEVKVARQVCSELDLKFVQVDTTNPDVAPVELVKSEEFQRYCRYMGGYSNFVWLYEFFAVRYLKANKLIAKDAIFVPGHSGDSFAGSHLIKGQVRRRCTAEEIAETIVRHDNEYGYSAELVHEVTEWAGAQLALGYEPCSVYQTYIFQNRQAHQIVNAARAYAFFGYEVRMPLFDKEFAELFRCMPYRSLRRKTFYNQMVMREVFRPLRVDFGSEEAVSDNAIRWQWKKERFKELLPKALIRLFSRTRGTDGEYELMQPLLDELVENEVYKSRNDSVSVNRTIRDWYLMKVKQELGVEL